MMKRLEPSLNLGQLYTLHKHGFRSLPIFSEMRPIASAFNFELLKRNFFRTIGDGKPPFSMGPTHALFLCKLYSIGIEGRHLVHMSPKEEEIRQF